VIYSPNLPAFFPNKASFFPNKRGFFPNKRGLNSYFKALKMANYPLFSGISALSRQNQPKNLDHEQFCLAFLLII